MGKKTDVKMPETPDLVEATRAGYLADIETKPMQLTADAAYRAGTTLYKNANGNYFTGEQAINARGQSQAYVDSLLVVVPVW